MANYIDVHMKHGHAKSFQPDLPDQVMSHRNLRNPHTMFLFVSKDSKRFGYTGRHITPATRYVNGRCLYMPRLSDSQSERL